MEPPRPEVTVSDPGRPGPPPDVLDVEPSTSSRRALAWVVAALVLGAAVLAVQDVRADRAAAAEERRLASVVDLSLTERIGYQEVLSYEPATRRAVARITLELRNGGPRDLQLLAAETGDLSFAGDVPVEAGNTRVVALEHRLTCPPPGGSAPALPPTPRGVRLRVAAGAGERDVEVTGGVLPLDQVRTIGQRACGFLPLEEAVRVSGTVDAPAGGDDVLVFVSVTHRSVRPVRLSALDLGGLEVVGVVDLADGRALRLPLPLAPAVPGQATRRDLLLTARVADCRRADLAPLGTLAPGALGTVAWVLDAADAEVDVGPVSSLQNAEVLQEYVLRVCPQQR